MKLNNINIKNIRPFVKWAGGKASLVDELEKYLPADFDQQEVTYIEPFVGGGGMLFYMLTHHHDIQRVIISDINRDLMTCYELIKNSPNVLIHHLTTLEQNFCKKENSEERRSYYLKIRQLFNEEKKSEVNRAAYFIFLNHTCFNGLYRVNSRGLFNVPFGIYKNPKICNTILINEVHKILQSVNILWGSYQKILEYIRDEYTFIYMDPPYRRLAGSTNFIEYDRTIFGDKQQEELKAFCDILTERGCKIMQSNSYSLNEDGTSYFDNLYEGYYIDKILAYRYINVHVDKRDKQEELVIKNYNNTKVKSKQNN